MPTSPSRTMSAIAQNSQCQPKLLWFICVQHAHFAKKNTNNGLKNRQVISLQKKTSPPQILDAIYTNCLLPQTTKNHCSSYMLACSLHAHQKCRPCASALQQHRHHRITCRMRVVQQAHHVLPPPSTGFTIPIVDLSPLIKKYLSYIYSLEVTFFQSLSYLINPIINYHGRE